MKRSITLKNYIMGLSSRQKGHGIKFISKACGGVRADLGNILDRSSMRRSPKFGKNMAHWWS